MRVGFAGTPQFAAHALAGILGAGYDVPLVLTQPDRPQGRGMRVAASPVKSLAAAHGLPVLQPPTLRKPETRSEALAVPLDVLVVAAYGLILPPEILAWPRHGCLNIHASLLPRWRGAAPIQRALEAGDAITGITIMQMDAGLDTGPMLEVVAVPIAPRDTAASLHDRLEVAGADALLRVLARLARDGALRGVPQPAAGATYAHKIERVDAQLDWTRPAEALDRAVRAFDPVPGAHTACAGEPVKIWEALPLPGETAAAPGTVLAAGVAGIDVACGAGTLRIATLQPAGGKRLSAAAFCAGRHVVPGTRFAAPPSGPADGPVRLP
jgi:methionyl-tRNA formyltransferase